MSRARRISAPADRDRGAAMVELALILPLLVMLLIGIVQFGMVYSDRIAVQAAAREGARLAALGQSSSAVDTAVRNAAPGAGITGVTVTRSCPTNPPATSTERATVVVTGEFTFSIPFISLGTRSFDSEASMRCGL